jgi:hypothetical protein
MMPNILLAFGFEHLPMLGWLAAAGVPLLIHLLSRQKQREVHWAAMMFLLAAVKRQSRRIRLEQWLLLLVRTLIVALVVLAMAVPFFNRAGMIVGPSERTHRVLVIDGSYSMDYRSGDRSRFERAKQWALQLVDQSSAGDAFSLILMASPPRVIIGTPTFEQEQVRQEIEGLELLHGGADLQATLQEAEKLVSSAKQQGERFDRQEVYFLSDMQRGTWSPTMNDASWNEFRSHARALVEAAELMVVDLSQGPADNTAENIALTRLSASDGLIGLNRTVDLHAEVRDFGQHGRTHQPIDLIADGHTLARQFIDVPPGGTASAALHCKFDTAGDHAIEVRAMGDNLPIDNHRYLSVNVRANLRVLCIDGRPSGEAFHGAADYLLNALSSASETSGVPIHAEAAGENALRERELAAYDCVFLANVPQFTAGEAQVLDAYVARGGSLVFFLGDQVMAQNYNTLLGAGGNKLLPGRLGDVVSSATSPAAKSAIDPLGYQHPIVQAFRGHEKVGLLSMRVWKYFKLDLPSRSPAQTVLSLASGDPLIVAGPVRRGRVVVVTTSADTTWSAMPLFLSYVPLMQEIVYWSVRGQSLPRNVEVGEQLQGIVDSPGEMQVTIERPDGQRRAVSVVTAPPPTGPTPSRTSYALPSSAANQADTGSWSLDETYRSGFYTARWGTLAAHSELFAVNGNTAESQLASIDHSELEKNVWPGVPLTYENAWQAEALHVPAKIARPGQLHVGLLYALLALLFLETVLAWRFGYQL